jgi:hypothetical protein
LLINVRGRLRGTPGQRAVKVRVAVILGDRVVAGKFLEARASSVAPALAASKSVHRLTEL